MNAKKFRAELLKSMPGYKWTVHKSGSESYLSATGIQSSGLNRIATLAVTRTDRDGSVTYTAAIAGYGAKANWVGRWSDGTLTRAFRGLQTDLESMRRQYAAAVNSMVRGRSALDGGDELGQSDRLLNRIVETIRANKDNFPEAVLHLVVIELNNAGIDVFVHDTATEEGEAVL